MLNTGKYTEYIQYNKKRKGVKERQYLSQLGIKEPTMIMLKYWKDHVNGGTGKHIYQFRVNKLTSLRTEPVVYWDRTNQSCTS